MNNAYNKTTFLRLHKDSVIKYALKVHSIPKTARRYRYCKTTMRLFLLHNMSFEAYHSLIGYREPDKFYQKHGREVIADVAAGKSLKSISVKFHKGYHKIREYVMATAPDVYRDKVKINYSRGKDQSAPATPPLIKTGRYECSGCAMDYRPKPIRCIKCNSEAFEEIKCPCLQFDIV